MNKLRKSISAIESSKEVTLPLVILAFVASSMTLWLLESPLKPILYFIEAALISVLFRAIYTETLRRQYLKPREEITLENLVFSRLS